MVRKAKTLVSAHQGKKPSPARSKRAHPPVEIYTPERKAEFLLSNTVNAAEYYRAVGLVLKMGLDPARIPHHKPPGV